MPTLPPEGHKEDGWAMALFVGRHWEPMECLLCCDVD